MSELTTTPFKHYFDFQRLMDRHGRALGWKPRDTEKGYSEFVKQVNGVWYSIKWPDESWATSVFFSPTTTSSLKGDFEVIFRNWKDRQTHWWPKGS